MKGISESSIITQTTIDAFRRQWINTQKTLERWKHYTWLLFQIEEEGKKKKKIATGFCPPFEI